MAGVFTVLNGQESELWRRFTTLVMTYSGEGCAADKSLFEPLCVVDKCPAGAEGPLMKEEDKGGWGAYL